VQKILITITSSNFKQRCRLLECHHPYLRQPCVLLINVDFRINCARNLHHQNIYIVSVSDDESLGSSSSLLHKKPSSDNFAHTRIAKIFFQGPKEASSSRCISSPRVFKLRPESTLCGTSVKGDFAFFLACLKAFTIDHVV